MNVAAMPPPHVVHAPSMNHHPATPFTHHRPFGFVSIERGHFVVVGFLSPLPRQHQPQTFPGFCREKEEKGPKRKCRCGWWCPMGVTLAL